MADGHTLFRELEVASLATLACRQVAHEARRRAAQVEGGREVGVGLGHAAGRTHPKSSCFFFGVPFRRILKPRKSIPRFKGRFLLSSPHPAPAGANWVACSAVPYSCALGMPTLSSPERKALESTSKEPVGLEPFFGAGATCSCFIAPKPSCFFFGVQFLRTPKPRKSTNCPL